MTMSTMLTMQRGSAAELGAFTQNCHFYRPSDMVSMVSMVFHRL